MINRPWLSSYSQGVPADVDLSSCPSLVHMMEQSFARYADRVAFSFLDFDISFAEVDRQSRAFAIHLQGLGLVKGDRVAVMMPNCLHYPIAVAGALRAGLIVVNVNPSYTPRELEYQLKDSGAKAIVLMEDCAATLRQCVAATAIEHVVLAAPSDRLGFLPHAGPGAGRPAAHPLPKAVRFDDALAQGAAGTLRAPEIGPEDIAVLQYTGGTTGVSKGAMLRHRNVVANALQSEAWNRPIVQPMVERGEQFTIACAPPLFHIFAFATIGMMMCLRTGARLILISNARDLSGMLKELSRHTVHGFPATNTLYNALLNHPDFDTVDWKNLRLCIAGGMALQSVVARLWFEKTGCHLCEGYGLTEASPSVVCNPVDGATFTGAIGVPMSNTYVKVVDDQNNEVPIGQAGELVAKGPQVMAGYWQRPDETAQVMTPDGYLKTGDIVVADERGYLRLMDRKKDMILTGGFNVYPNEIEEVVKRMPGVLECAVIGIPDDQTSEAVKLVIVKKDPGLTKEEVHRFCYQNLTDYKRPRVIEFLAELPKTPVGKILRRELRAAGQ
jgi:long-chain acyl-CoA synthetase